MPYLDKSSSRLYILEEEWPIEDWQYIMQTSCDSSDNSNHRNESFNQHLTFTHKLSNYMAIIDLYCASPPCTYLLILFQIYNLPYNLYTKTLALGVDAEHFMG